MTNTITVGCGDSARSYFPLKYPPEVQMISPKQKKELITLIYQNLEGNERELRLMELDDLTFHDADFALYQYSMGKWS
jgi:hypothetical protein